MLSHIRKSIVPLWNMKIPCIKLVQPFTIKNYMKTYQLQNVQRSQAHTKHNIFRVDQYKNFVSEKQNLDQFLQKQKKHYQKVSKRWQSRTKKYYQQTSSRRDTRVTSTQQQYDNYSYYTSVKFIQDKQYTVIYRRHNQTRKQQLVLDIMQYYSLKRFYKTIQLMRTSFSQSHRYVAFGYDLNNNQHLRWMIKDTKQNKILGVKGWQANVLQQANQVLFYKDKGLFYTKTQNRRPCQLYYQQFDSQPQLLYQQKDPSYWMYIQLSKDKTHLILSLSTKSNTKIKCLKLPQNQFSFNQSNSKPLWTDILSNSQTQKLQVNHCSNQFVIWRQSQFQNTISVKKDTQKNYQIIHTLHPQQNLTDIDIFQNQIVLYIQKNTKPIMRIINTKNNYQIQQPSLPHQIGKITPGMNQVYNSNQILFYISTPFIYNQGYTYQFNTKKINIKQKFQMTGSKFNLKKYQVQTLQIPALDGQKIPLTILAQKRSVQYPKKLMLKVYGYYGLSNQVSYDNLNYSLLQNGWTIAYAHVRGGGDKGKNWHIQAQKNKSLVWSDLQDCIAYLIRQKYTHPSLLFLQSHSAGAIAVWNMINKAPHLFKAVIMNYPFIDVLNTLLDPNDALSASDHAQFGNPLISKKAFRQIQSISPYQNIQQKSYPFIYIVGGQNDYRCPVQQLVKFVKRFRKIAWTNNRYSNKISQKGILLKVHDNASHLGTSDISQQNYNNCQIYGFLDYLVYEASNDCKY